jgi:hypothetical protein
MSQEIEETNYDISQSRSQARQNMSPMKKKMKLEDNTSQRSSNWKARNRRASLSQSKISGSHPDSDSERSELVGIMFEHNGLLKNERLFATVPAYESNHMRHYLTDWD